MIRFEVSLLPLLVVAIVNFFLSWLYYSPVAPWFRPWLVGVGKEPGKMSMGDEERRRMPLLMGSALFASLLFSYGLQVIVHSVGATSFLGGAIAGLVCWLAFAVTHSINTLFEGRKLSVLAINNGLYIVTYAALAGLVAVWH